MNKQVLMISVVLSVLAQGAWGAALLSPYLKLSPPVGNTLSAPVSPQGWTQQGRGSGAERATVVQANTAVSVAHGVFSCARRMMAVVRPALWHSAGAYARHSILSVI